MPRKSDVFSPVTEPQFRIVLQRLVPCFYLKSCQWCQSRFAPPNQSEDKQESTTWEMLVSEFHVFFWWTFWKKRWFSPWIFCSIFLGKLAIQVETQQKITGLPGRRSLRKLQPGILCVWYQLQGVFFLVGWGPEVWHFHPWKVTETQKGKKVVFQCVPFLLKCCLEFLHQKTKPTFQKTCHLTVVQKRRPSALVQQKSWENIFH